MRSTYYSLIAKAHRYAEEKDRFQIQELELTCHGSNGDHLVRFDAGKLRCDCDHFQHDDICAHVLAAEQLFRPFLPAGALDNPYAESGPALGNGAQ